MEAVFALVGVVAAAAVIYLLARYGGRVFRRLTCKGELGEGPRRVLLLVSVPFFVFFFVPGIFFWLLVKLVLWVVDGFREDRKERRLEATSTVSK